MAPIYLIYRGRSTPNRALSNFNSSNFFHFLLNSRVKDTIKKAGKKAWKSEFLANLHPPPKIAKFFKSPFDMPIFGNL